MVDFIREIDPDEDTCEFCAGLVPTHSSPPYNACAEHFQDAKRSLREAGVETKEIEKEDGE